VVSAALGRRLYQRAVRFDRRCSRAERFRQIVDSNTAQITFEKLPEFFQSKRKPLIPTRLKAFVLQTRRALINFFAVFAAYYENNIEETIKKDYF
jgi:hypothetical protein